MKLKFKENPTPDPGTLRCQQCHQPAEYAIDYYRHGCVWCVITDQGNGREVIDCDLDDVDDGQSTANRYGIEGSYVVCDRCYADFKL